MVADWKASIPNRFNPPREPNGQSTVNPTSDPPTNPTAHLKYEGVFCVEIPQFTAVTKAPARFCEFRSCSFVQLHRLPVKWQQPASWPAGLQPQVSSSQASFVQFLSSPQFVGNPSCLVPHAPQGLPGPQPVQHAEPAQGQWKSLRGGGGFGGVTAPPPGGHSWKRVVVPETF